MSEEEQVAFEVKKKCYQPPEITVYGSFSERTQGAGLDGDEADGATYYGQQLLS